MKKKVVIAVTLLLVSSLLLGACAAGVTQEDYDAVVAGRDTARGQVTSLEAEQDVAQELIAVLQATGKYHDVNTALADGYVSTVECVQAPPGGMGIHYVNFALMEAPPDLLKPLVLLYNPTDGGVKLIGVEYFAVALASTDEGPAPWFEEEEPADGWFSSAPSLLGQTFNGPMASHGPPDEPWHYDLHIWLWEENPSGMYADFNPNVSCPE